MIDETNLEDKVTQIVQDYLKTNAFPHRKVTDTPTDALQVVNKKYVDAKIAAINTGMTLVSSGSFSTNIPNSLTDLFTVSGLAGDTDLIYKLVFFAGLPNNNGSGLRVALKLNNSSNFNRSTWSQSNNSATLTISNSNSDALYLVGDSGSAFTTNGIQSEILIKATKTLGGKIRHIDAMSQAGDETTSPGAIKVAATWGDITNEITGLTIQMYDTSGPEIITGKYWLYKLT